jgi:3-oxoacyl-(acyl-carrier-protein) synthase
MSDRTTAGLHYPQRYARLTQEPHQKPFLYLYDSLRQAMTSAGWDHIPPDTGLIFATTTGFVPFWEKDLVAFVNGQLDADAFSKSFRDHPLGRPLAPLIDGIDPDRDVPFNGPVRIITSACAAGTQALVIAREWISAGTVRRCIVAGTELLSTLTVRGFASLNLISRRPCAPFDQERDGINLSEAAGVILLERADLARNQLAVLSGGGTSLDSFDMTSPDPSGDGIARAAQQALASSGLDPTDIDWMHAHGTGSQVNDVAEAAAARRVFGEQAPPLTSTKGVHGHALAASGIIETTLCIEAMRQGVILGTAGHRQTDQKVTVPIQKDHQQKKIHHILKTTLGFGGVNAAVVLSAPDAAVPAVTAPASVANPVYIAAAAWAKRGESEHLMQDPSFRKATIPMMMAWQAVTKALAALPQQAGDDGRKHWGLVFGTSHGELEVTRDFLVTLVNKGLARPILFQNSLHHSTLGFISLKLGISGPGLTVSNHFFSGEDAIASARDMISSGACDVALTVAVDALVDKLGPALGQYYPQGTLVDEGAGCLLLANDNGLQALGLTKPLAALTDISCVYGNQALTSGHGNEIGSDYDSDAVEKAARYLTEVFPARKAPGAASTLTLRKPDGTRSRFTITGPE